MEKTLYFKASGRVLGNLWGGGVGAYPIRHVYGYTKEELLENAKKSLDDGSLDSGMGFESLIGAVLDITISTKIEIEDEVYINEKFEFDSVGELSDEQHDFLMELCLFN